MKSPSMQFIPEITADGSPTLRLKSSITDDYDLTRQSRPESMHHSGGAATETEYIYGQPLKHAFQLMPDFKTTVVGLGLGYIEMILLSLGDSKNILSFETDHELISAFVNWLKESSTSELHQKVCLSLQLNEKKIRSHYNDQEFCFVRAGLNSENYKNFRKSNVICFDAFSSKTTAHLWSEDFLTDFIAQHSEDDAVFTTYACTGSLKRALRKNNFEFMNRKGFTGKRDSTLAVRGLFKNPTIYLQNDSHSQ